MDSQLHWLCWKRVGACLSSCPDIGGSAGACQYGTVLPLVLTHRHISLPSHFATDFIPIVHPNLMSQAPTASTSVSTSPNFQTIFYAALREYEKKTKKDLIAHPLAAQLQACKSSGDILAVLQEKVKEFDQSRSADERLSQWLNPTINVLYSFSATIGAGVGIVSTIKYVFFYLSPVSQVFSPASVIFSGIGVLLSVRPTSLMLAWGQFTKSL